MTKKLIISALIVAVLAALGVGMVYAQTQNPPTPTCPGNCPGLSQDGYWQPNGGSGRGGPSWDGSSTGQGFMHEYMIDAFAGALNLTPEELEARLEAGDTMGIIAQEVGMSIEQFFNLMLQAREEALQAAVSDGSLTQEQADGMLNHMNQRGFGSRGSGASQFGGGCYGGGGRGMGGFGGGIRGFNR